MTNFLPQASAAVLTNGLNLPSFFGSAITNAPYDAASNAVAAPFAIGAYQAQATGGGGPVGAAVPLRIIKL